MTDRKSTSMTQRNGIFEYPAKKFPRGIGYGYQYVDRKGRNHRKGGFRKRSDAVRERARIIADMNAGTWVDPRRGKATVGQLGDIWLAGKVQAESGHDKYESLLRVHVKPEWGDTPISNIVHSDVQRWVGELAGKYSGKQVRSIVGVLSMICAQAVRDKRIADNPCNGLDLPRPQPQIPRRYLTMPELLRLGVAARTRQSGDFETFVLFMGLSGLRFGEAIALRVQNVRFEDDGHISVYVCENAVWSSHGLHVERATKNGETRTVYVPSSLGPRLRKACAGKDLDSLVFPRPGALNAGECIRDDDYMRRPNGPDAWWASSVRAAGLPKMRMHDLRHTAVSLAIHRNCPPKIVQRIAGHKTFSQTMDCYADLYDEDLKEYADLMDEEYLSALSGVS